MIPPQHQKKTKKNKELDDVWPACGEVKAGTQFLRRGSLYDLIAGLLEKKRMHFILDVTQKVQYTGKDFISSSY